MIGKIKKAIDSIDDIENLKKEIRTEISFIKKEFRNSKQVFDEAINEIRKNSEEQKSQNNLLLTEQKDSIKEVKNLSDDFNKVLNDFKLMSNNIQKKVIQEAVVEIKKEISVYINNIKEKTNNLNEASKEIVDISKNISEILKIFNELKEISKNLKKEDFELSKYAEKLRENDKEKLELMRKIDNLERLIAKQRNNSSKNMPKY